MSVTTTDDEILVEAVTSMYLEHVRSGAHGPDWYTTAEIAQHLGWAVTRVRRALSRSAGCPDGIDTMSVVREHASRSYPGLAIGGGAHRVQVYTPSRRTLARLLVAAEEKLHEIP